MGSNSREMAYKRQEFDYPLAKKPKLSFSTEPSTPVVSQKNDYLWGEDLPEFELDECFELATQACSQLQSQSSKENQTTVSIPRTSAMANTTIQQHNSVTTVQVSQKLTPSDIFKVPGGGNLKEAGMSNLKFRPKQWSNVNNRSTSSVVPVVKSFSASQSQNLASHSGKSNELSTGAIPVTSSVGSSQEWHNYSEQMEKLQIENAKLKQQFLTKDGEVSILRTQLKQSDAKASSHLQTKIQEYEAKIRAVEKELEKSKTIAELQKLEAWKAKDKLLTVASQQAVSAPAIPNKSLNCAQFGGLNVKMSPAISYGELLLDVITPHLFIKSSPEINLVELKNTFSLLDDTSERTRIVFNPIHYTVENCWESSMQLGLEESFDTTSAQCHLKKIFNECYKILCCLLITLRERAEKETDYNLDSRELQNSRAKVDALDDPNLLSHEMWYKSERGVEARRVLGLVAEVSLHSKLMADLVNGTSHKRNQAAMPHHLMETNHSEGKPNPLQNGNIEQEHQLVAPLQAPSTSNSKSTVYPLISIPESMETALASEAVPQLLTSTNSEKVSLSRLVLHQNLCVKTQDIKEEQFIKIEEIICSYKVQDFGFLKLIRDITLIVASQNHSFEYSGFLSGVVVLLTYIQRNSSLMKDNNGYLNIFCEIVETIIHSRPRMETTVALAELIDTLRCNTKFMNALCNFSRENINTNSDHVEENDQNQNMCALSMLCWLLERETNSSRTRTRVCQALIDWMMVGVKCRPFNGPKWTQCQSPKSEPDKCFCRIRMIEAMVILIYRTFLDFEVLANTSKQESVRSVLVRGIMLLYYQLESDPDFGHHMDDVEGYYQLLLMGLKNTQHNLRLGAHEARALEELLAMEETITPPIFELTRNLEKHMDSIITTIEQGWSEV